LLTEVVFAGGTHFGDVAFATAAVAEGTGVGTGGAATVALSATVGGGGGTAAAVIVAEAVAAFTGSGPLVGSLPFITKITMLPRPRSVITIATAAVVICLRRKRCSRASSRSTDRSMRSAVDMRTVPSCTRGCVRAGGASDTRLFSASSSAFRNSVIDA
jgi:hypothetical protein